MSSKRHEIVAACLFFAGSYILIQWVVISFGITRNGTIRWADGWQELLKFWGL